MLVCHTKLRFSISLAQTPALATIIPCPPSLPTATIRHQREHSQASPNQHRGMVPTPSIHLPSVLHRSHNSVLVKEGLLSNLMKCHMGNHRIKMQE